MNDDIWSKKHMTPGTTPFKMSGESGIKSLFVPLILFLAWILHLLTRMIEKLWPIQK